MGFGRGSIPRGRLQVFSVADEKEAEALIVLVCTRGMDGEYYAPELIGEQTLENLELFAVKLAKGHAILKAKGHCRCVGKKPPRKSKS